MTLLAEAALVHCHLLRLYSTSDCFHQGVDELKPENVSVDKGHAMLLQVLTRKDRKVSLQCTVDILHSITSALQHSRKKAHMSSPTWIYIHTHTLIQIREEEADKPAFITTY